LDNPRPSLATKVSERKTPFNQNNEKHCNISTPKLKKYALKSVKLQTYQFGSGALALRHCWILSYQFRLFWKKNEEN
jgi:hypothetical protein